MGSLLLPLFNVLMAFSQTATSTIAVENCDFGEVYSFAIVDCQFQFANVGPKAVRVSGIVSNVATDSFESHELVLPPHSSKYLPVKIAIGNAVGATRHILKFDTDQGDSLQHQIVAYGFALSALEPSQPDIDFGIVELQHELTEKTVQLESHNVADFQVTKILEKPQWIDASIGADHRSVTARVRSDAPWGPYAEFIKVEINTPDQRQAWISVSADIRGEVIPGFNPFNVGVVRSGGNEEYRIPLQSTSGKPFSIGKISLDNIAGETRQRACEPDKDGCRWVVLKFSKEQPIGVIKGSVFVDLPALQHTVKISVRGVMLGKDSKIKSFDAMKPEETGTKSSVLPQAGFNLNNAIKSAVQKADLTPPPGNGPLLQWTVANGRLIHGFQIFRAEAESGPFVLLNRNTLPANVEDDASKSFQYRDNTAKSGAKYWYYIGIVNNDGRKQHLSDPQKVIAK